MSYLDIFNQRNNAYGDSMRDIGITTMKRNIISSFYNSPSYYQVDAYSPSNPLSSTTFDCWITDDSDVKDQKNIIAHPNQTIDKGYLIYWTNQSSYWLVTQADVDYGGIYSRGTMQKCNATVKWLDSDGTSIREAYFCYKTDTASNFGVSDGKILIMPNERRTIVIQSNQYTNLLRKDKRFIFDNRGWKVTSIDGVINGLISIVLTEDDINIAKDNSNLRIANYYDDVNDYEIKVSNIITNLEQSSNYQILAKVYNHDVEVVSATPTYTSSNTNIMTVSSSGLVTGVAIGTANITISYGDVSKVLPIEIMSTSVTNRYVVFDTVATIWTKQTKTFEVHYENNGVTFVDTSIFSVTDTDGNATDLVTISSQSSSDNSCVLKANSDVGSFILNVHNTADTISGTLTVKVNSLL